MSRRFEIQKLLIRHQRRLQKLQEKEAVLGVNTPPEILIEIEDIKANIENLHEELENSQPLDSLPIQQQYGKKVITQPDESKKPGVTGFKSGLNLLRHLNYNEVVWHDKNYIDSQTGVLMEKDFYNRETEKAALKTVLHAPGYQPAIIVGERRSGKTSMLKLIINHFEKHPSGSYVPIYLSHIHSRDEFIREILANALTSLNQKVSHIAELQYSTPNEFIQTFRNLMADFPQKRYIACMDEMDSCLINIRDITECARIVDLILNLVEIANLPLRFLFTIAYPLDWPQLADTSLSRLTYKSLQVRLRPFSKSDFDEMVIGIVEEESILSPDDIQRLYILSGGWPYYAKVLLNSLAQVEYGVNWFEWAISEATANFSVSSAIANIYRFHFDDNEKILVLLLAVNGGSIEAEQVEKMSRILKTAARKLTERDYLITHSDGSLSFRIGFLTEWFLKWDGFKDEVYQRLSRSL